MKTRRHHFAIATTNGVLTAYVPDEGGEAVALARLKQDDDVWKKDDVLYHGVVEWFEPISFQFAGNNEIGLGDAA